jgi:CheY-like chemotaxis protein
VEQLVLVVDDNAHNREYARQVLSEHWEILLAGGGREALRSVAARSPSLVLLDLSMPHMTGWDVLRELRGQPATADIPVIACTAHAMAGDRERALQAGFNAYLAKPVRPAELVAAVEGFLGPAASAPQGAGSRAAGDEADDGWGGDDWSLDEDAWEGA